jgi:multicomponent Na+:H+ antiporter subunit B
VVTTAARTVTPFVLAYGVYLTLHGTALPGGAFQGGIVLGATVVLIGLAFGFDPTREWIHDGAFAATLLFGIGVFGGFALGAVALGGDVLEVFAYPLPVEYTVKVVEVAIAAVVAGVVCGLVIWIAAGVDDGGDDE